MTFDQVPWGALAVGLTAIGLVLTWTVGRRRGAAAVVRGLAWSLVPLALFLTGTIEALWQMGAALVSWVTGFVFELETWAGVAVAGLALLLFLISGFMRGRGGGSSRRRSRREKAASGRSGTPAVADRPTQPQLPASQGQQTGAADDDDFSDIEEILRRRGIS
jgi:hypothetical protein